eukprot:Lithocolla_globosa_v1_NODE_240_length_4926_cov_5.703552.p1 type:complete len:883 gc:universal NODE_240_length_4926_cov_5.703552:38-2686(+)
MSLKPKATPTKSDGSRVKRMAKDDDSVPTKKTRKNEILFEKLQAKIEREKEKPLSPVSTEPLNAYMSPAQRGKAQTSFFSGFMRTFRPPTKPKPLFAPFTDGALKNDMFWKRCFPYLHNSPTTQFVPDDFRQALVNMLSNPSVTVQSLVEMLMTQNETREGIIMGVLATMNNQMLGLHSTNHTFWRKPTALSLLPLVHHSKGLYNHLMDNLISASTIFTSFLMVAGRYHHFASRPTTERLPGLVSAGAVLMNIRNQELSLVQHVEAVINYRLKTKKDEVTRLNHQHRTMSFQIQHDYMVEVSKVAVQMVISWVKRGIRFRAQIDNFDLRQKVKFMRLNNQNRDHHWIWGYLAAHRIDTTGLDNTKPLGNIAKFDTHNFLPSGDDHERIKKHMTLLVARRAFRFFPTVFGHIEKYIPTNLKHRRTAEMSKKSELVALPMFFHNQIKNAEVVQFFNEFLAYLENLYRVVNDVPIGPLPANAIDEILVYCDELLVVRGWSAQRLCSNGKTPTERLAMFFVTFSDWHAIVTMYHVFWELHYKPLSCRVVGTMSYFRNITQRRNVRKDPSKDVNASKDWGRTYTDATCESALKYYLGMVRNTDKPVKCPPPGPNPTQAECEQYVEDVFGKFVDQYINCNLEAYIVATNGDGVSNYHRSVLNIGMFIAFWEEAVNVGDGDAVASAHKVAMLHYFYTGHWKYALQTLIGTAKVECMLTAVMSELQKYERFVNIPGGDGNNHEGDVVLENRNGELKSDVKCQGPNLTADSVQVAATSFDLVRDVTDAVNAATAVRKRRGTFKHKDDEADRKKIVAVLDAEQVWDTTKRRVNYRHFDAFPAHPFCRVDTIKLYRWLSKHRNKLASGIMPEEQEDDAREILFEFDVNNEEDE